MAGKKEDAELEIVDIGIVDILQLAFKDLQALWPNAMDSTNSIVGSMFSMLMQGISFIQKIAEHAIKVPENAKKNLSAEALQAAGTQQFLDKVNALSLTEADRNHLIEQWQSNSEDRSIAWIALADHCLRLGKEKVYTEKMLIDKQLSAIKKEVTEQNEAIDNAIDPTLAEQFKQEVLAIEEAELAQINTLLVMANGQLLDERENTKKMQPLCEQLGLEYDEKQKKILSQGKALITRYYDLCKNNHASLGAITSVQNGPDNKQLLDERSAQLDKKIRS